MWLNDMAEKGEGKYIEVFVDDVKVTPRTNRFEAIEDHKPYLDESTNTVKIFVYNTENSNRFQQFTFFIEKKKKDEPILANTNQPVQGLSGIDLENKINERLNQSITQERERWQNELLRRDFEECKKKLTDAEEYIEQLEEKLGEFKGKKLIWGDVNLGEVASVIVEGMVKRNPHWVAKLPGGDALAGLIAKESNGVTTAEVVDGEVEFKKKTTSDSTLNDEVRAQLELLKLMETHFNQQQLDNIMLILQSFVDKPEQIETVYELLNLKKENEKV
jgi:hypothetical protein